MNKLSTARVLMVATILLVVAFQFYWIKKLYREEDNNFKKSADIIFRETMYRLQAERFTGDTMVFKGMPGDNLFMTDVISTIRQVRSKDSAERKLVISMNTDEDHPAPPIRRFMKKEKDTVIYVDTKDGGLPSPHIERFLEYNKTINDSIPVKRIDSMYSALLVKEGINVVYRIIATASPKQDSSSTQITIKIDSPGKVFATKRVPVGFISPVYYKAEFADNRMHILKKISPQLFLSLLLIALTTISFVFIYRSLLAQKRLTEIKNEFIGNITHELKTPIATVSVAIEAMKNFDALQNPARTKEYLGIAGQELNRLSLLVDKVLRLSMFET
ncbi:MAG TPA: histidine kinase dimerization/phospho-acceptor domain-containing protein, partial [Ferruginibacter sp.]|nr:histidine kinase dimerization/phospho-acceptor domain-containing protein [Ferruginibacter sp.]